jgi:hypothetical protein
MVLVASQHFPDLREIILFVGRAAMMLFEVIGPVLNWLAFNG